MVYRVARFGRTVGRLVIPALLVACAPHASENAVANSTLAVQTTAPTTQMSPKCARRQPIAQPPVPPSQILRSSADLNDHPTRVTPVCPAGQVPILDANPKPVPFGAPTIPKGNPFLVNQITTLRINDGKKDLGTGESLLLADTAVKGLAASALLGNRASVRSALANAQIAPQTKQLPVVIPNPVPQGPACAGDGTYREGFCFYYGSKSALTENVGAGMVMTVERPRPL